VVFSELLEHRLQNDHPSQYEISIQKEQHPRKTLFTGVAHHPQSLDDLFIGQPTISRDIEHRKELSHAFLSGEKGTLE